MPHKYMPASQLAVWGHMKNDLKKLRDEVLIPLRDQTQKARDELIAEVEKKKAEAQVTADGSMEKR